MDIFEYKIGDEAELNIEEEAAKLLLNLNPQQQEAVLHEKGPLLVLAGAGSGKTKVITHRIAYLISCLGYQPENILAITFTNKAAQEMQKRLASLVGEAKVKRMWVGTFHSMFLRILRRHADKFSYPSDFTILDTDDQAKIIRAVSKNLNINDKLYPTNQILSRISSWKNKLKTPNEVLDFSYKSTNREQLSVYAKLYEEYQKIVTGLHAMDFDDILFNTVKLFRNNKDILQYYQNQFLQILVDEYQDTNTAQYVITRSLAEKNENICVVGDDDQSIYSFRGADIGNILSFEKDYKNAKLIKLEQNYRSTSVVLDAANAIISTNKTRKTKKLWTANNKGEKICVYTARTYLDEAEFIAKEIKRYREQEGFKLQDIAVLYRMNVLSRTIEDKLRLYKIPCTIYGGLRFYERRVIKDMMAYLRFILNPNDYLAFDRIVNVPARSIGEKTKEGLKEIAREYSLSLLDACHLALNKAKGSGFERARKGIIEFVTFIEEMQKLLKSNMLNLRDFVEIVEDKSGLVQSILDQVDQGKEEMRSDIENLREMLTDVSEFLEYTDLDYEAVEAGNETNEAYKEKDLAAYLSAYLERATLYSVSDLETEINDTVKLMTIHQAKGLEYKIIFVAGMEQGIFPSYRSVANSSEYEEERRLAYVAITRAKEKLYLSYARERRVYGKTENSKPSDFIKELPENLLDKKVPHQISPQIRIEQKAYIMKIMLSLLTNLQAIQA